MYITQSSDFSSMSEEEYLAFADEQEIKHEYRQGLVFAMSGASVRHNTITANMIAHLISKLSDRDCTVTTSDTRIHIASKQAYRYPDVTVFCGDPTYLAGRTDTITNPALLVEVLSPATAINDRNEKLEEYTQIESLQAYVLVAQDTAKIEVFRRHESGKWLYEYVIGLESVISVPVTDEELQLSLAQVYRRISWQSTPDENTTQDDESQ